MEKIRYRQEEGQIENRHKLPLSRARAASGPTSTALSGSKKAWAVKGANLLTRQAEALAALGQAGCSRKLVSPPLGAWLPEAGLE